MNKEQFKNLCLEVCETVEGTRRDTVNDDEVTEPVTVADSGEPSDSQENVIVATEELIDGGLIEQFKGLVTEIGDSVKQHHEFREGLKSQVSKMIEIINKPLPRTIVVLGNTEVGKTRFIKRFFARGQETEDSDCSYHPTIGSELCKLTDVDVGTIDYVWEFCGNPRYLTNSVPSPLRNCDIIIIVKDSENRRQSRGDKTPEQWCKYLVGTTEDPRVKLVSSYQEFEQAIHN